MSNFHYALDEHVAVLTMDNGENRFNYDNLQGFGNILDEIENVTEATTLVVKSADPKIWSNGIDLDWLSRAAKEDPSVVMEFPVRLMTLIQRILTFPMITIAAINGHAFAGGAIMSCAFDFRFMRSDRGYFCLPEIDLGIPFRPSMDALLKRAMPRAMVTEAQFTGKRYTADELVAEKVAVKACHQDDLMDEVMTFAKALNKDRQTIKIMKQVTHKDILRIIEVDDPVYHKENRGAILRD
jgi:enoyl-CoA hydratase/carnithine racemase